MQGLKLFSRVIGTNDLILLVNGTKASTHTILCALIQPNYFDTALGQCLPKVAFKLELHS